MNKHNTILEKCDVLDHQAYTVYANVYVFLWIWFMQHEIEKYIFVDSEIFVDHGAHLWIAICVLQLLKSNKTFRNVTKGEGATMILSEYCVVCL